jgi:hypothetical protein
MRSVLIFPSDLKTIAILGQSRFLFLWSSFRVPPEIRVLMTWSPRFRSVYRCRLRDACCCPYFRHLSRLKSKLFSTLCSSPLLFSWTS